MKAIGTTVLVKPMGETRSKGGLILINPEGETTLVKAKVVSVGNGEQLGATRKMEVKEGDIVLFNDARGVKFKDPETREEYKVLDITDIFLIDDEHETVH